MARTLIHLTHGPEHRARAAQAFQVARAASQQGHSVTILLVGDALQFARDVGQRDRLDGPAATDLRQSYEAALESGASVCLSDRSAPSQSGPAAQAPRSRAELATPHLLVRLAAEHDQVFSY